MQQKKTVFWDYLWIYMWICIDIEDKAKFTDVDITIGTVLLQAYIESDLQTYLVS